MPLIDTLTDRSLGKLHAVQCQVIGSMVEPADQSLANSVSTSARHHRNTFHFHSTSITWTWTSWRPYLFSQSGPLHWHLSDGTPCSRVRHSYQTDEDFIGIESGIRSNTVGAAWLDLPSKLHTHTGVLMSTRAEFGLRMAGISDVWLGISSVSYLSRMDSQSHLWLCVCLCRLLLC